MRKDCVMRLWTFEAIPLCARTGRCASIHTVSDSGSNSVSQPHTSPPNRISCGDWDCGGGGRTSPTSLYPHWTHFHSFTVFPHLNRTVVTMKMAFKSYLIYSVGSARYDSVFNTTPSNTTVHTGGDKHVHNAWLIHEWILCHAHYDENRIKSAGRH